MNSAGESSSLRARISGGYRLRIAAVAIIVLFFAGFFLYDGYIAYPRQRTIAETYETFQQEGRLSEWEAYARDPARNWPTDPDAILGKKHTNTDILTQRVIGFVLVPVGLAFLIAWLRTFGRWIEMDPAQNVLRTNTGLTVPLDDVKTINLERWKTKGIAVVEYETDRKTGQLTLDDWKFERAPIDAMVEQLKTKLGVQDSEQASP